ncbi:interferon regulatory factor 10 [Thalassophryne amazonica]|uniref:interferon regulatory factor 10 n=1 Tax=Thalassophryne amazonica TaxID=390379 RepID=UPI001470DBCA|nr:interferon regulatory factor 10 [Thalassophryne amazonica]
MDEGAKLHLKEWLVAQIESGQYEGLSWEDHHKTMFRIPWKHASKKDYKQTEDAALFKAWAVYKGKYREGRDQADPTMWKTRLRCALNKSTDFQEVSERNQLDISEPYKVYRIQVTNDPGRPADLLHTKNPMSPMITQVKTSPKGQASPEPQLHCESKYFQGNKEEEEILSGDLMQEHRYCGNKPQREDSAPSVILLPELAMSDFRMQVMLFYHGQRVMNVTTSSPEGCFIVRGRVPLGNERIYGPCNAQHVLFPPPDTVLLSARIAEEINRLFCFLEGGVLLWVAPDGMFMKRFCKARVYWSGPMAQHKDQPNKLDREKTFKLLDMPTFYNELQSYVQRNGPTPSYEIELCFGEDYPDPSVPKNRKLVMAQVVPLFAKELLQSFHLGESEETWPALTPSTEDDEI